MRRDRRLEQIPGGNRSAGMVMPLVAVAMTAIFAVVGLAIDFGWAYLNRDRLQNAVDAAALSAARTLVQPANNTTIEATQAANLAFAGFVNSEGNTTLTYQNILNTYPRYSSTLSPWVDGSTPAKFVKVKAQLPISWWLLQVIGVPGFSWEQTAVAGPSNVVVCGNVPFVGCGYANSPPQYGYVVGQVYNLKRYNQNGDWDIGPGNFGLFAQSGGDYLSFLSGAINTCAPINAGSDITTIPGSRANAVGKALNTRFDAGSTPPWDFNVCTNGPDNFAIDSFGVPTWITQYPYSLYNASTQSTTAAGQQNCTNTSAGQVPASKTINAATGIKYRRLVKIIIADCTGTSNGSGSVSVKGSGCFFLLHKVDENNSRKQPIFAEYIGECPAGFGGAQSSKVVLYRDD